MKKNSGAIFNEITADENIIGKSEMDASKFVNEFNVYGLGEFIRKILINNSEIYIPKENMGKNNYVKTVFEYKPVQVNLKFLLLGQ